MQTYNAGESDVGKRVDVLVSEKMAGFTRASLKSLFEKKQVLLNNRPTKPGHKLHGSDRISIDTSLIDKEPLGVDLEIIYEDKDVVVINKPAGMLSHSKGALNPESTVATFLKGRINDKRLTGNRAGIVHRLDRPTSGVMIGAKNEQTLKWLQKQFSDRKVQKTYLAVIEGELTPEEAVIDVPIERNPKRPQTFRAGQGGKPSQTRYKVLRIFSKAEKQYSLVELVPITGRTHQLRVHLAYLGHPIAGDNLYGHGEGQEMFLHAAELELRLPSKHKKKFTAPLPYGFDAFIKA